MSIKNDLYHRGLRFLSRALLWLGITKLVASVGILLMIPYIAYHSWNWDLLSAFYKFDGIVRGYALLYGGPDFRVTALGQLGVIGVNGILIAVFWLLLSRLVKTFSLQKFSTPSSVQALKLMTWILVFSFAFDLFDYALISELKHRVLAMHADTFSGAKDLHELLNMITNHGMSVDLAIPHFNGAIKLVLALGTWLASKTVQRSIAVENELKDIKEEHELII